MRNPYQSTFTPVTHPGGLTGLDGLVEIIVMVIVLVVRVWSRRALPNSFGSVVATRFA